MEVQEIVTELYTLRAGLSLISREKDAFDAEVAAAEEYKNNAVAQARTAADNAVARARETADDAIFAIENRINRAKESFENRERHFNLVKHSVNSAQLEYYKNEDLLYDTRNTKSFLNYKKVMMPLKLLFGILFILSYFASAVMSVFLLFFSEKFSLPTYLFIPVIAVALTVAIIEIIMAVRERELKQIGLGIPYAFNLLFIGVLMLMSFQGIEDVQFLIVPLLFTIGSDIACIIFTSIITHVYKTEDIGVINNCYEKLKERALAIQKQSVLKERAELEQRRLKDEKMKYDSSNEGIDFAEMEEERERTVRVEKEKYEAECAKINEQYDTTHREQERKFSEVYAASAEVHGKISNGIWDTLVKTYGELLDVRDWGILDLVIWQLETGRAETLKEALQLADRETQTDRIVRTMQSASAAIAQRIDDGFGNLQAQLSSSFYTLAKGLANATGIITSQISRSSDLLIGKIDESTQLTASFYENQNENMLATNRNLEELFSQTSLQTALLEKSNSSSKALIDAVNKLRKVQSAMV